MDRVRRRAGLLRRSGALHGADAFHSITLEPGAYDFALSTTAPGLDLAFAVKASCDATACSALVNASSDGNETLSDLTLRERSPSRASAALELFPLALLLRRRRSRSRAD